MVLPPLLLLFCNIFIFFICFILLLNFIHLFKYHLMNNFSGDAMGNVAAAALVGPSGNRCCRYCNVLHKYLWCCNMQHIPALDKPVVRNSADLPRTQQLLSVLRLAGQGFKLRANAITPNTGITEEYVSTFNLFLGF